MQPEVELLSKKLYTAIDDEVDSFLAYSDESDVTRKELLRSIYRKKKEERRKLATELSRITEIWQTK